MIKLATHTKLFFIAVSSALIVMTMAFIISSEILDSRDCENEYYNPEESTYDQEWESIEECKIYIEKQSIAIGNLYGFSLILLLTSLVFHLWLLYREAPKNDV